MYTQKDIEELMGVIDKLMEKGEVDELIVEDALKVKKMLTDLKDDPLKLMVKFQRDRMLDKQPYTWSNEAVNIVEELFEALGYDVPKDKREQLKNRFVEFVHDAAVDLRLDQKEVTKEDIIDAFADICEFSVGAIMKNNYCPRCVLFEMGKHINSRTGKIVNGKFQKDPNVKVYEPNYQRCELGEKNE